MNEKFEKLLNKHPIICIILMFAMTAGAIAALIGVSIFAEWVGGNL